MLSNKIKLSLLKGVNYTINKVFPSLLNRERRYLGGFPKIIDKGEASMILNLKRNASEKEIKSKH